MWGAEIVIGLMALHKDIELICVIPFEEQAVKWPCAYRERYFSLLESCTKSIILNTSYTPNSIPECCQFIVDRSNILLAVCDSKEPGINKAGYMVNYGLNIGRDVIYIHPVTLNNYSGHPMRLDKLSLCWLTVSHYTYNSYVKRNIFVFDYCADKR